MYGGEIKGIARFSQFCAVIMRLFRFTEFLKFRIYLHKFLCMPKLF